MAEAVDGNAAVRGKFIIVFIANFPEGIRAALRHLPPIGKHILLRFPYHTALAHCIEKIMDSVGCYGL